MHLSHQLSCEADAICVFGRFARRGAFTEAFEEVAYWYAQDLADLK